MRRAANRNVLYHLLLAKLLINISLHEFMDIVIVSEALSSRVMTANDDIK